ERWLKAIREQRWAATEENQGAIGKTAHRPLTLAEIFRERESRRRVLLMFTMSLASIVGWWAISTFLPSYTEQIAKAQGYANFAEWGNRAAILYTIGAVSAYFVSVCRMDAILRRSSVFRAYPQSLLITPVT